MSLAEIEKEVLSLSEEERWQFVEWFYQNQGRILPRDIDPAKGAVTEAMKAELLQRKQEYLDHPERFRHVKTREELKEYFDEIRNEVRARAYSGIEATPPMINGFETLPAKGRTITAEFVHRIAKEFEF